MSRMTREERDALVVQLRERVAELKALVNKYEHPCDLCVGSDTNPSEPPCNDCCMNDGYFMNWELKH